MHLAVERGFVVCDGRMVLDHSEQVPTALNIAEILPQCNVSNKDALICG
jgi:hypothetical protein